MILRKQGIAPISIFKLYYKVLSTYNPNNYSDYVWKRTKEIRDKQVEYQIEKFLKNKYTVFNDSLPEIEDYFRYCFSKEYNIYFPNLGQYISEWQKNKIQGRHVEEKYKFADIVKKYLSEQHISFQEYISKKKRYLPKILQHYITKRDIPFEVIIYLDILKKCDIDKKKLKFLLYKEYQDMENHTIRTKKLESLIKEELLRILKWEKDKHDNFKLERIS